MRETGHGVCRRKHPSTATGGFLQRVDMRRAVSAEEISRITRCRRLTKSETVLFTLGDGQAVIMRADTTDQDVVAVDDQMMRRDRRAQVGATGCGIGDAFFRRDMLHHHPQAWC